MRKLKLHEQPALYLKKDRITSLTASQSQAIAGGFTYSLSLGARCNKSKEAGQNNPYDCGIVLASSQICIDQTVVKPTVPLTQVPEEPSPGN